MSYHNENCATLDECECDRCKIESLRAKVRELESQLEGLKDPHAVWVNMLRGTIAFPQHLKAAEDRVHELEADYESVCQSNKTYEWEVPQLRHRIKELEEVMPDPKELRSIRRYLGYPHLQSGIRADLESMADRIERVMKRE